MGRNFKINVLASHLWLMGSAAKSEFGLVVLVTGVLEKKTVHTFPFGKPPKELDEWEHGG